MLKANEMKAIKDLLVDAGSTLQKDEKLLAADVLATLRYELRCDNHELHRIYSLQLRKEK